jgi:MFS family permease
MEQLFLVKDFFKAQFPWITISLKKPQHALWNNDNFRLFLTSECAGIFGSHFYQLALPLMVKEYTGSAGAMSVAMVLSGISRVAFMMVGGTLSDRFSPRQLILASGALRAILLLTITAIALAGQMNIIALYGFSFASGLSDAIFLPARGSVMPLLVERELLKAANAIASAQEKLWGLVGPVMAGLFISWMSHTATPASSKPISFQGPAIAFLVDILAIVISILILRPVKFFPRQSIEKTDSDGQSVENVPTAEQGSIRDVIRLIREKASLRVSFLMVYAINCISSGPLYIGMPMLAVSRFPEGAQALGFLTSAIGGGALIGTLMAGILPQPKPQQMHRLFLTVVGGLIAGIVILVLAVSVGVDALAILVIAGFISYINVTGLVQIQKDTPPAFMGRMMGLLNLK